MPSPKKVKISLKKKANGTWKLVVDPVDVWIKRTTQEVVWKAENVDVKAALDKPEGSPFSKREFKSGAGTEDGKTGEPTVATQRKYRYTLTITPNPPIPLRTHGNLAKIILDPEIVVDDSGPPA
jgi:hypothetical protein